MARMASGNPDDALDIVQDTMFHFARLYANRPEGEWNVLFYKILHSRITDWYRRTAVRRRFHDWFGKPRDDEADEEDPMARVADSTSPDPAEGVMRQEFTGALQAALRKLPLRQQQAFVLRAWEGFDTAQTAQAMGCSEGSVKTHYSRAIHALQIKLEEFQS
jgi:RNA polymerase sigma-70 factor (ECF subfamily)